MASASAQESGARRRRGRADWARLASTGLGISYPVLAHAAIAFDQPRLVVISIGVLIAAMLVRPITAGRRWAWSAAVLATLVLMVLVRRDLAGLVLYAPPVLINLFMAWLFGHTLLSGRTPLIERLAMLMRTDDAPLEGPVRRYTARLTAAWTALFVVMAAVNLALALFAVPGGLLERSGVAPPVQVSRETWSLFANVLNYAVVAAFFVLEYAYRWWRFPVQPYDGPADFVRQALAAAPMLFQRSTDMKSGKPGTGGGAVGEAAGSGSQETCFSVPPDHPALPGHFPGRPVVPAVLLLEAAIEATEERYGPGVEVVAVSSAKFTAPLLPDQQASLSLEKNGQQVRFRARRGSTEIMSGRLQVSGPQATGDDDGLDN